MSALPGASCIQAQYYAAESGIRQIAVLTEDKIRCQWVRAAHTEIGSARQVMLPSQARYTRERRPPIRNAPRMGAFPRQTLSHCHQLRTGQHYLFSATRKSGTRPFIP